MKKLLIGLVAASAAAVAVAASMTGSTGTSFESIDIGTIYDYNTSVDKDPADGGNQFWKYDGQDQAGVITNRDSSTGWYTAECGLPSIAGETNLRYLALDCGFRVERSILAMQTKDTPTPVDIGGVYFDAMVQFTPTYCPPTVNTDGASRDKIGLWLYAPDGTDAPYGADTNLVICANMLGNTSVDSIPTNYVISSSLVKIEPDSWHRVTIKSLETISYSTTSLDTVPGFVVFIDGIPVKTGEALYKSGTNGETLYSNLAPLASKWNTDGTVFPSMDLSSNNKSTISVASFIGTGAIDDIMFTDTAPEFAADAQSFTLTWSEGLATLTVDGETPASFEAGVAGSASFDWASSFVVTATPDSGYTVVSWNLAGTDVKPASGNSATINPEANSGLTITMAEIAASIGDTTYPDFESAFNAAQSGDEIVLGKNVSLANDAGPFEVYGLELTIDLNGKTIETASAEPIFYVGDESSVTIISSSAGGTLRKSEDFESGEATGAIYIGAATGSFTLGDTENDTGVLLDGWINNNDGNGSVSIVRGTLYKENYYYADSDDAAYAIADGSVVQAWDSDTDEYFTVLPGGEEPAKTLTITLDPATGVYKGSAFAPVVTVTCEDVTLTLGTDYTLGAWSGNLTDAGTYTATVTGIGNYEGASGTATFTVNPKTEFDVELSPASGKANGTAYNPEVTVKDGATTLTLGTDYTLGDWSGNLTDAGEYTIEVTGIGNYAGAKETATFTITAGYDSPDGTTSSFTIADESEVVLPTGVTSLGDSIVIDGVQTTYAVAYALGLLENGTLKTALTPAIAIADGKVTLSFAGNENYDIQLSYKASDVLSNNSEDWSPVEGSEFSTTGAAKKFYKIDVSSIKITNK